MPRRKAQHKTDEPALDALMQRVRDVDAEALRSKIAHPMRTGVLPGQPESELGRRIQEARQLAGLTQGQLSARTALADEEGKGISAPVISLYERGINKPGPREVRLICEALRVSPNVLIYGDEDPFGALTEAARFGGWAASEPEFLAVLTYCFGRLHHHHRQAIMDLMMGLLRGWNRGVDADMDNEAVRDFLRAADQLKLLLKQREKAKK